MSFVLFNSLSHARRKARACVIIIMVFDVYLKSQGTILEILRTFFVCICFYFKEAIKRFLNSIKVNYIIHC